MNFRSSSTIAHKPIQKVDCMYGTDAVRNASTATAEKVSAFKVSQTKSSHRTVKAQKNECEHVKAGEALLENVHEPPLLRTISLILLHFNSFRFLY